MTTPIYRLFFLKGCGSTAAEDLSQRVEVGRSTGARTMLLGDMRWSNERFDRFGVELFPDLAAAQAHTRALAAAGWYGGQEVESFLGIPMDETADAHAVPGRSAPGSAPIYRVYLTRSTGTPKSQDAQAVKATVEHMRDAFHEAGGQVLLSAYSRWCCEEWDYFGVERFPSMDALLSYSQFLTVQGWYAISQARSYLGTATGGELAG